MPIGYQPSKFQSFNGKGNLKQPVTHFIETCNNVEQKATSWSNNLFIHSKGMLLIGT